MKYPILAVSVSNAKSQLSKYLGFAKKGREVVITEHKVPVAKLVPVNADDGITILAASEPVRELRLRAKSSGTPKKWDSVTLLLKEREES